MFLVKSNRFLLKKHCFYLNCQQELTMENPFEILEKRLERIEQILEKIILQQDVNPVMTTKNLMNVKELSSYLTLSVYTIYGLTHKRSIPFIKKGRRLYFEKKEIDLWLQQDKQKTKEDLYEKADEYLLRNPL